MAQQIQEIEVPALTLRSCSTEAHCRSLLTSRSLPFWWFRSLKTLYSLPFQDNRGAWWYQAGRGYAWPADLIDAMSSQGRRVPYRQSYLGYQHVVPADEPNNSTLVFNTILDLETYSPASVDDKRRNAIRKGGRACEVIAVETIEDGWLPGVVKAWNDLVQRTGWNQPRDAKAIRESWLRLLDLPAATILLAIERASGQVAGFLITKVHGDTAYVDTIASNSDLLKSNPNDILMYAFIRNAQRLSGVRRVHYAIKSSAEHLEKFKTSLGFVPHPYPAILKTRPGMMTMLRTFKPQLYRRLTGQID